MSSSIRGTRLSRAGGLVALALSVAPLALAPSAQARPAASRAWSNCSGVTRAVPFSATTRVNGMRVNRCVAGTLQRMVNDAASQGVWLTGSGWRNISGQIALRKANCGGAGHAAVWVKPASSCHPATAIPGRSMHERGLAVDFTSRGPKINSRSVVYRWLRAHAASYGFHNLPAEPWHWSLSGR